MAETACAVWLRLTGHRILVRNYRTPVGEIDIVARRGQALIFVEVKARRSHAAGAEALAPRQQRRIERAAEHFLAKRRELADCDVRFDLMLVQPWRPPVHVRDAWRPKF